MRLKRTIGPWGILFASVGSVIGAGWLFGTFFAAIIAGPGAVFSWILGGFLMLIVAFTFVELATMLPVAGGVARFSHFSHGTLVSFTMGWCGWLASLVVAPIETMALLQYASNYLPWLVIETGGSHVLSVYGMIAAAIILCITCIINYLGVHWVSKTNIGIVAFKIAIPTLTVVALALSSFEIQNFTSKGFLPYGWKGVVAAMPSAGIIFSFVGYNAATQLAGEAKNPGKMIPIAIVGSCILTMVLYALLQITFIGAVELNSAWLNLSFTNDNGPFVGIAETLGLYSLVILLYADAVISPFGTALIYTSSSARINYAMSFNGYMPNFLKKLTKRGVPINALIMNYCIGLILFLPFPGWQSMVKFLVSSVVLSYAVGPIALIALREKLPNQKRIFSVPCAELFCLVAFYICNLLVFWSGWAVLSKLLFSVFLGYCFLWVYRKKFAHIDLYLGSSWWIFPYLIGLGILSYCSSFGGGLGLISFGIDFLCVALFSGLIFYLAKSQALEGEDVKEMLSGVVEISHIEVDCFKE